MRIISFQPSRFEELGLRRAVANEALAYLVAAMALLAALAIVGWIGAGALALHWSSGTGSRLTIQVPRGAEPAAQGSDTRLSIVQRVLAVAPGVESAQILSNDQVGSLLGPWLGTDFNDSTVPIPAVIRVHFIGESGDLNDLAARLTWSAPDTTMEDHAIWEGKLADASHSLRFCSGLTLLVVALATTTVTAMATRWEVSARSDTIRILSQLGATDGYIAQSFALHAAALASIGGVIGGLLALPVIFALTVLAMPLTGGQALSVPGFDAFLPSPLPVFFLPILLSLTAASIGYCTIQIAMRWWLRRLP